MSSCVVHQELSRICKVNNNLCLITEDVCVVGNFQRPSIATCYFLVTYLVANEGGFVSHVNFLFASDAIAWVLGIADAETDEVRAEVRLLYIGDGECRRMVVESCEARKILLESQNICCERSFNWCQLNARHECLVGVLH
jgi:hypothetical protein